MHIRKQSRFGPIEDYWQDFQATDNPPYADGKGVPHLNCQRFVTLLLTNCPRFTGSSTYLRLATVTTLRQHPMVRGNTELLIYGKACSKMSTTAYTRACSCGPKISPWIGLGAYSYCWRVAFSLCCWESCGRN